MMCSVFVSTDALWNIMAYWSIENKNYVSGSLYADVPLFVPWMNEFLFTKEKFP